METETLLAQYQHFMQDPALVRMHRDLLARMRAAARAMEQEGAGNGVCRPCTPGSWMYPIFPW